MKKYYKTRTEAEAALKSYAPKFVTEPRPEDLNIYDLSKSHPKRKYRFLLGTYFDYLAI